MSKYKKDRKSAFQIYEEKEYYQSGELRACAWRRPESNLWKTKGGNLIFLC